MRKSITISEFTRIVTLWFAITFCLFAGLVGVASASAEASWRLYVNSAATVEGSRVLLGEIAKPVGNIHPKNWEDLAKTELWPSPPRRGRPMTISRVKLRGALKKYLGDMADMAVLPSSLAIQTGGTSYTKEQVEKLIVSSLTQYTASLAGEPKVRDIEVPEIIFLRDKKNRLELEPPTSLDAGRLPLRLREVTAEGKLVRRVTGGAFLDIWVTVPCAARPLNRHDAIGPEDVTFVKKNLAYVRGQFWDGKGGPWRILRAVGTSGVIYQTDLEMLPAMQRGDKVALVFRGKALRLTVPAEAMEDGRPGDTISVRNLQSNRKVYGTVQDSGTVVIQK